MTVGRHFSLSIVCGIVCASVGFGQRHLGPKDRDVILGAKLDPAFTSAPLEKVIFLPIVNELDYAEGAMILSENFIASMRQAHPDMVIMPPQEAKLQIESLKLGSGYRAFMGNYSTTGVATMPFLSGLSAGGAVDAVLLARILGFGVQKETTVMRVGDIPISWSKNKAMVGMTMVLLRTKDGRELWRGHHVVQGQKNENVRELAKVVSDVFAAFFGRVPY